MEAKPMIIKRHSKFASFTVFALHILTQNFNLYEELFLRNCKIVFVKATTYKC